MEIGAAILARRNACGITQQELARRAVMTAANLCAIEAGRRDLTVGTLLRIARSLGISPAVLFHESPRRHLPHSRFVPDTIARGVISGRRKHLGAYASLADGLAWICRPSLMALGAPGAGRASRIQWRRAQTEWSDEALTACRIRTHKLLESDAWRGSLR